MAFQAKCVVSPADTVTMYISDNEVKGEKRLAVVCESQWGNRPEKASTILTKEDAIRMRELLNEFIGDEPVPNPVPATKLDILPADNLAHLLMKDI